MHNYDHFHLHRIPSTARSAAMFRLSLTTMGPLFLMNPGTPSLGTLFPSGTNQSPPELTLGGGRLVLQIRAMASVEPISLMSTYIIIATIRDDITIQAEVHICRKVQKCILQSNKLFTDYQELQR